MQRHFIMEYYEIVVESHIDKKRLRDFGGMDLKHLKEGNTLISGYLRDQVELISIVRRIGDMNLKLISINKLNGRAEE